MLAVRRISIGRAFREDDERLTVQVFRDSDPLLGIDAEYITAIEEQVKYWRKANHIHGWFVDNVQDEQDDCGTYRVAWAQLEALKTICEWVIKASELVDGEVKEATVNDSENPNGPAPVKVIKDATVAKRLLPTRLGFFFGSEQYDEYYLNEVKETRDWIALMIDAHEDGVPGDILYSSSW